MADQVTVGLIPIRLIDVPPSDLYVPLGDLRPLSNSIKRYGVLEPIDVEIHGNRFSLRFGRHRMAACDLAKISKIPAVIHTEQIDEQDLLERRVQENLLRVSMDDVEKRRIIFALRKMKCTDEGIARTFATTPQQIKKWAKGGDTPSAVDPADAAQAEPKAPRRLSVKARATSRLMAAHANEFEAYLAEEKRLDEAEKKGVTPLHLVARSA